MKVTGLLFCAEAAVAASLESRNGLEKRQIGGTLAALMSGDTAILGALGSMFFSRS